MEGKTSMNEDQRLGLGLLLVAIWLEIPVENPLPLVIFSAIFLTVGLELMVRREK